MTDIRRVMFIAGYEIALCNDDEVDALEAWRQYVEDGELDVALGRELEVTTMIEIDHTTSDDQRHTCANPSLAVDVSNSHKSSDSGARAQVVGVMTSPHVVTMHFDLTDPDGRTAFEFARLGESSHLAIWTLWSEMCKHLDADGGPDQITHLWIQRLIEILGDYDVPLEIG